MHESAFLLLQSERRLALGLRLSSHVRRSGDQARATTRDLANSLKSHHGGAVDADLGRLLRRLLNDSVDPVVENMLKTRDHQGTVRSGVVASGLLTHNTDVLKFNFAWR